MQTASRIPPARFDLAAILPLVTLVLGLSWATARASAAEYDTWLGKLANERGIIVVVGPDAREAAKKLVNGTPLQVAGVLEQWEEAEAARRESLNEGIATTRLSWHVGNVNSLPFADNIASYLLVAGGDTDDSKEVLRVLRPRGSAWIDGKVITKPVPAGVDDWTHPYYGPHNNPASQDTSIRAPYLTQFMADPRYAPAPQFTVAAGGRVFKIYGHIAWHEREEPFLNVIVAYDGYNGTQLWRYALPEGMMIHRNVFVATPEILYVGDHESCKLIDTQTGRVVDRITPPQELADGTFWKWMAIQDGTLYALVGESEFPAKPVKWKRDQHGWPWNQISPGFNSPEQPWGFGKTLLAFDLETKKVKWHHREAEPVDARAICMSNDRLFAFRFGSYLTCLDADSGKVLWRRSKTDSPKLFETLGEYLTRQSWRTNWRTVVYLKCSNEALYFAGPQLSKLVVLSTEDGRVLWEDPYDNYQLILRPDAVFAISGPWGVEKSKKFDPLTGKVLAELPIGRRACTRPTATMDSILFRAMGGSVRLDVAAGEPRWISPMRPACHDGVTIANGLLYWWPYVCDCQLSINGVTALTSAGNFDFSPIINAAERYWSAENPVPAAQTPASSADWPTFRGNNQRMASSPAKVVASAKILWRRPLAKTGVRPTAPIVVGDRIWVGGDDGVVRCLDARDGKLMWQYATGGEMRIAPTYWQGRLFAGSDDGWVYCWDAAGGKLLWRTRTAPAERLIPVYGKLLSTWPAASGVLVDDGVAYVAAGRVNYDGTYVYALDAATGEPRWCNDQSGFLDPAARTGVSVMGHLLLNKDRLYLAGGNAVSPAVYDAASGKCLNDAGPLSRCESTAPRGWELFLIGDRVIACGKPFYSRPEQPVFDHTVSKKILHTRTGDTDIVWLDGRVVAIFDPISNRELNACVSDEKQARHITQAWGTFKVGRRPRARFDCPASVAIAVASNAFIVAQPKKLTAVGFRGDKTWETALPADPLPWGLAISAHGNVITSLENGEIVAIGDE